MNRRFFLVLGMALAVLTGNAARAQEDLLDAVSMVPTSTEPPANLTRAELEEIIAETSPDAETPAALRVFRAWDGIEGVWDEATPATPAPGKLCAARFGASRERYAVIVYESTEFKRRVGADVIAFHAADRCFHRWRIHSDGSVLRLLAAAPDTKGEGASELATLRVGRENQFLWTGEVFQADRPVDGLVVSGYEELTEVSARMRRASLRLATFDRRSRQQVATEKLFGLVMPKDTPDPAEKEPEASPISRMLADLFGGSGGKKVPAYRSAEFGLAADWGARGGLAAPEMATQTPAARSVAKFGFKGSAAVIIPLDLDGLDPDFDALAHGLLAAVNVNYPIEVTSSKPHRQGSASGREIVVHQVENGNTFDCLLRVLRNGDTACLIGGWSANGSPPVAEELAALLDAVTFTEPAPRAERPVPDKRYLAPDAEIVNGIGIALHNEGDYEAAAVYFRAAFKAQPRSLIFFTNILEATEQAGRQQQALAFLREHLGDFPGHSGLRAREASLLYRCERHSEAVEKYAALFDGGFEDEDHLLNYLSLLTDQGLHGQAIETVTTYLDTRKHPSLRVRRWQAQVFSHAGKTEEAVAAFTRLVDENPGNPQFNDDLLEALVDGERADEALVRIDARLLQEDENATLHLLRGRANFLLEHHRRAKEDFEKALARAPGNPDIGEWLAHASAALGQGDNTAIKIPLEAVPIPPALAPLVASATDTDSEAGAGYSIRFLANVTGFHFRKGERRRRTDYRTVRILNRAGVESYGTLHLPFDPLFEKIFVNQLEVFDEDGIRVAGGKVGDYYVSGGNASEMATTERVLYAPVPGLRVGHTVKYVVTREDKSESDEFAFENFILASDSPCPSRSVFVTGDIEAVRDVTSGGDFRKETAEGSVFWLLSPVPFYQWETFQPKPQEFLPSLALGSDRRDWKAIGNEFLGEIADRIEPSDETRALAEKITAGLEGDEAKADALVAWVQNEITYQAIEFGHRARIPNTPARIVENRYGDCKDHSVLLHDLFRAVGIESQLVLINGSAILHESLPSLDQFNHMIVRAPGIHGGYFDCTSKFQSPNLAAPEGLAGARALVLDPARPALETLPPPEAVESVIESEREITVLDDAGGDVLVGETLSASGYYGGWLRGYFHNANAADHKGNLQQILGDLGKFELEEVTVENIDARAKPLVLRMRYRIRKAARLDVDAGNLLPPALWEDYYFKPTFTGERKNPFAIEQPMSFTSRVRFTAESRWRPVANPDEPGAAGGEAPGFSWLADRKESADGWSQTARLRILHGDFPREAFRTYQRSLDDSLDALKAPVALLRKEN